MIVDDSDRNAQGHRPDGRSGPVVGAGNGLGLPLDELRPLARRGHPPGERKASQAVRRRGDRRPAGRRLPDRCGRGGLGPDRERDSTTPIHLDADALGTDNPGVKAATGPFLEANEANTPDWRRADMGGVNGHGNARSVARVLSVIARGGEVDGTRLLSPGLGRVDDHYGTRPAHDDLLRDEQDGPRHHRFRPKRRLRRGHLRRAPEQLPAVLRRRHRVGGRSPALSGRVTAEGADGRPDTRARAYWPAYPRCAVRRWTTGRPEAAPRALPPCSTAAPRKFRR